MRVAIHQPNFAPWSGFFAKMFTCEAFVFLDDAQMPGGSSYVNRTRIAKGGKSSQWLTVPAVKPGLPRICEVRIAQPQFAQSHLSTLRNRYSNAAHRDEILELIRPVYMTASIYLARFNMVLIQTIAEFLGWDGRFLLSTARPSALGSDKRLAELVSCIGGTTYVSGAGGERYQKQEVFRASGVELDLKVYEPIRYFRSGWDWVPGLSCLDVLFHQGRSARDSMRYQV